VWPDCQCLFQEEDHAACALTWHGPIAGMCCDALGDAANDAQQVLKLMASCRYQMSIQIHPRDVLIYRQCKQGKYR
jgi:hypothetical protein